MVVAGVGGLAGVEVTAMKYFLSVIDNVSGGASGDEIDAIDAFNARLVDNGQWVFAAGLGAPITATVFDNRDGKDLERPGGYSVADEFVSGFWIIDVDTADTARHLAAEASHACNRRVELRPFL